MKPNKTRSKFNIFFKAVLLSSVAVFLFSCDQILDVDIPANQIDAEYVFNNVQTADAALANLYGNLRDSSPIAGGSGTGILWGTYTDDLDCYSPPGENTGIRDVYLNLQNDSNLKVLDFWTSSYKNVYIANAIIEGVEKSNTLTVKEKSRIKGEALLMRSLIYFYLMQIYGDIPYTVTTDFTVNQSLSRTPFQQVCTFIENDLNTAVSLLDDNYRNAERIYPNRKVAQLVLAKVYMTEKKWNLAESILNDISGSSLYSFEQDVTKVFLKSGNHILWQLKPKNANSPTNEVQVLFFENAAPNLYALTPDLVNTFSSSDKRLQNWITPVTVGNNTWYRANKYKNRTTNTTEYSIVFRIEEVYLLLAETLTQQNKIAQALPYFNATRIRAGLAKLEFPISKDNLLSEILSEDRKEFFTEMGHRFIDLKRFGLLSNLKNTKQNWENKCELWPVPQQEIVLNPNLKPQNSGY